MNRLAVQKGINQRESTEIIIEVGDNLLFIYYKNLMQLYFPRQTFY